MESPGLPVAGMVNAAPEKLCVVSAVEDAVMPDWVLPAQMVAEGGVMFGTVGDGFTVVTVVVVLAEHVPGPLLAVNVYTPWFAEVGLAMLRFCTAAV